MYSVVIAIIIVVVLSVIVAVVAARLLLGLVPVRPDVDALGDPTRLPPLIVDRAALHVAGTPADHEAAILPPS